jgi:hypothetical protein
MRIQSSGYNFQVKPQYGQRTGVNPYNKPYEELTNYEKDVVRYLKKEAEQKAEWEAKPVVMKGVHYAGVGLKAVGNGLKEAGEFIKDFMTGEYFQLFANGKLIETDRSKMHRGRSAWEK